MSRGVIQLGVDVGCVVEHTTDPVGTAGPVLAPAPGLHAAVPSVLCPSESIVADPASVSISDDLAEHTADPVGTGPDLAPASGNRRQTQFCSGSLASTLRTRYKLSTIFV